MVVYKIMPALRKIHESIGYAVMQGSDYEALRSVHLVRQDFLKEHKRSDVSPRNYADTRRLFMVVHDVTYLEGIGNPEAEWLGLDLGFRGSSSREVYKMAKERLERFGSVVPDTKEPRTTRIRVPYGNPKGFEDYLLGGGLSSHSILLKVFDSQKHVPIGGPILQTRSQSRLETKKLKN